MTMEKNPIFICFDPEAETFAADISPALVVSVTEDDKAGGQRVIDAAMDDHTDENRLYIIALGKGMPFACRFAAYHNRSIAAMLVVDGSADLFAAEKLKDIPIKLLCCSPIIACGMGAALRNAGNRKVEVTTCFSHYSTQKELENARNWLLMQNIADRISAHWIQPGLWNFESGRIDSFYLITGKEKGLVIDTGMGRKPVLPKLREMTDLPLEAAFTHVHGDHCYHADEFKRKYISPLEEPLLPIFVQKMMPEKHYSMNDFSLLDEGDTISLGGNDIEVLRLAGHTPGSLVFVDHVHHCMFTGDAIGSGMGVLMSIFGSLTITQYLRELIAFRQKISPYKDYAFYGGHRVQEIEEIDGTYQFHPLCADTVDQMITLCEKLLRGEELPYQVEHSEWTDEPVRYYRYGSAGIWITPSQMIP